MNFLKDNGLEESGERYMGEFKGKKEGREIF